MLKRLIFVASLTLACISPLSQAVQPEEDLLIDAAHQDMNYKERTLHFSGNVVVRKGNIAIFADELFVETNDQGDSEKLIALGKLAKFSQQGEGSLNISSQAKQITYQVQTEVLTFTGDATLTQGGSEVTGDSIVFDLIAQRVQAEGDKEQNGRVTTRLKVKKN